MDEYLRILKLIWSEKDPSFRGKYFQFSNVHFSPGVVQKPHPPIWVGGESPRAIRRAAELGDGWFPIDSNPTFPLLNSGQLSKSIARLRQQIKKAGRSPENVRIGYLASNFELNDSENGKPFAGNSRKIVKDIKEFESLGVSFLALSFLRENLEKTKAYSEKFTNEVLSTL
jgi:alkanesulfonate monooxygenase SsuD/methylene tetrahydromethanopterin reductase-like flavin-dependent oxidoreductase (luciferase family)